MDHSSTKSCPFCNPDREIILENDIAIAIYDEFPVSEGHTLIIPRRHVATIFDLTDKQYTACFALVRQVVEELKQWETSHLNIGVNCGEWAGQTINHAHIHIIPRYLDDVDDPRGGVRHIIPGKGYY